MNRDSPPTQPTQDENHIPPLLKDAVSGMRRVQFAGFICFS